MASRFYAANVKSASSSELEKLVRFLVYQLYQRAETTVEQLVAFSCATGVTGEVIFLVDYDEGLGFGKLELTGEIPEGMEISQELIDKYKEIDVQKDLIDPYMEYIHAYEEREDWE